MPETLSVYTTGDLDMRNELSFPTYIQAWVSEASFGRDGTFDKQR